jgi:hypothetical protein
MARLCDRRKSVTPLLMCALTAAGLPIMITGYPASVIITPFISYFTRLAKVLSYTEGLQYRVLSDD